MDRRWDAHAEFSAIALLGEGNRNWLACGPHVAHDIAGKAPDSGEGVLRSLGQPGE
jgi:hypothetical protein